MNHDPQLRDRQDKQARAFLFGGREKRYMQNKKAGNLWITRGELCVRVREHCLC